MPRFNELGLHKLACQLDALLLGQFARNGEFDLAGKLRVLALLGGFDLIPQCRAVGKFVRVRRPAASLRNGRLPPCW